MHDVTMYGASYSARATFSGVEAVEHIGADDFE
jgi:hypothetical protein